MYLAIPSFRKTRDELGDTWIPALSELGALRIQMVKTLPAPM